MYELSKYLGHPEVGCDHERLQCARRSNEAAKVLKLHVAHPVTRALRGCLPSPVRLAALSPF